MGKNNFQKVLFAFGAILFTYAFYYTVILFFHFDLGDVIDTLSTKDPNEIGDTVGGILNPLFAISICIFTGLAFYSQYEANRQVQEQFKNERTLTLIFKAIENKDYLISSTFGKRRNEFLKKEVKKLSGFLEKLIIEDLKSDFKEETELAKHESTNKFIKLVFERIKEKRDILKNLDIYDKKLLIEYFINNDSTRILKENKIGEAGVGVYIFIQKILQENLSFIYNYVAQINFILTQIEKLNESEQLYHYFFGTLKNEEICLLLYLYLYSIPNKIAATSLINLDRIDINAKFIEQIQKSNISLNYSNKLLVGEITIKELIEEIKRIEKYCAGLSPT